MSPGLNRRNACRGRCGALARLLASIALTGMACSTLCAQSNKVVELKSARELFVRTIDGKEVRELLGDVHFYQPSAEGPGVELRCDRALRYMAENRIELFGHVRIERDSVVLTAEQGIYHGDSQTAHVERAVRLMRGGVVLTAREGDYLVEQKQATFRGDVEVIDSISTTRCDTLVYEEEETRSTATGRVSVLDRNSGTTVYGDSLIHIQSTGHSLVPLNPRLVQVDSVSEGSIDTLVVTGDVMEQLQDSGSVFVAKGNVLLARDDLAARCGEVRFYRMKDQILLREKPVVWYEERQVTGDSMRIVLAHRRLRRLEVYERAVAASRLAAGMPERFDQMTGRFLTMEFGDERLERIIVDQTATSLYYLFDEEEPNGANKSSGDRIVISFEEGVVDRIRVIGGVQGEYFPENMIHHRETEYNLEGFRWQNVRPVRSGTNIVLGTYD